MIKALFIIVLTLVQISYAYADFQSDRKWADTHSEYPPIKLLYLGKRPAKTCVGASVDACIEKNGVPDKRQLISADEEHLFYYGKKILYRGTGEKNSALGPEWREIIVKSGKVADEFKVVQVIEAIDPFFPYERQGYFEEYGSNKIESGEIVPVYGTKPDIPWSMVQKMVKSENREEIHTVIFTLLIKRLCDADIKEFKKESAAEYARWRNEHLELVKAIEEDTEFKEYAEFMQKLIKSDPNIAGEYFPALSTCGAPAFYSSKEFSGRVVDVKTNEPVEGVVVVAQWMPRSWKRGEMGHYGLVEIYEAVTDKDGKYTIPGWGPKLREPGTYLDDGEPEISFFKKGYWYHHAPNEGRIGNPSLLESVWDGRTVKLKKFVFGEEIKYTDANLKPATRKMSEDDLDSMLSSVGDIFTNFDEPNRSGGIPARRVKLLAKEWMEVSKMLKKTRYLPDVIEKMLKKEEFKNE